MLKKIVSLLILLFIFFFLYSTTYSQYIKVEKISKGKAQGILNDIDSRMPDQHIYRESDKVGWAHETTHGLNSRLRLKYKVKNAYYILGGRGFLIGNPPFKLSTVANNTPQNMRGRIFNLYLVQQQQYWNGEPLYVFDELTAYLNGTAVGIQYNMKSRTQHSYSNALEMLGYCFVARSLCQKYQWKEEKKLSEFLDIVVEYRVLWLRKELKERGWLLQEHDKILKKYEVIK